MLNKRQGRVTRVACRRQGAQEIAVEVDGVEACAVNYLDLTGPVAPGDRVLLNTTAVDLGLGTGGVHFVLCNLSNPAQSSEPSPGHIMKLRYTPLQKAVLSVEEHASLHQEKIKESDSLSGMPVVCCELHSQIAPAAAAVKTLTGYQAKVAYIMTDGAALPIAFSRLVTELKEKGLVDLTITCGQAFGGDIEAINIYTALIAAKEAAGADVAIVCQGPGNAGTGCRYGFSGIQQGEAINAAGILSGRPIVVPRISFADPRERHREISHHSLTVLGDIALHPAYVALPELPDEKMKPVRKLLGSLTCRAKHEIRIVDGEPGLAELSSKGVRVTTMGRSVEEDREFFLAASAGGILAAQMLPGDRSKGKEL